MSYKHLTITERIKIEALYERGFSMREIAKQLHRSPSTISREINGQDKYCAEYSQLRYEEIRSNCGIKIKCTDEIKMKIEEKLNETWSPEQISNRLFKGKISFKTIYSWIYKGVIEVPFSVLRQKGKRQKPRETRGKFNIGTSISKRPKEIRTREIFGHWELDTVVSSRGKSKGCVATFIERKTRYYVAILIPDRSAKSMELATIKLYNSLPDGSFLTATTDRGKEFSCYKNLEETLNIKVYFADAYSSWQRGSNENSNGLLREFFPKKTDFAKVSGEELNKALNFINNRPRKCLGWKTAHEALGEEVLHLT